MVELLKQRAVNIARNLEFQKSLLINNLHFTPTTNQNQQRERPKKRKTDSMEQETHPRRSGRQRSVAGANTTENTRIISKRQQPQTRFADNGTAVHVLDRTEDGSWSSAPGTISAKVGGQGERYFVAFSDYTDKLRYEPKDMFLNEADAKSEATRRNTAQEEEEEE